ncbi:hypothetical protein KR032_008504 [Drosophila birchii]|nr:hypothetical protein KR032_008504 [Drosophila birchii]
MLLDKLLWIIATAAILYGASTQAHPLVSTEKPGSHIPISLMKALKPKGNIDEGFCTKPKLDNAKQTKVDDKMNCGPEKSPWTQSHLKGLKALHEMILRKDLPALLNLKRMIEHRIPRKAIQK